MTPNLHLFQLHLFPAGALAGRPQPHQFSSLSGSLFNLKLEDVNKSQETEKAGTTETKQHQIPYDNPELVNR